MIEDNLNRCQGKSMSNLQKHHRLLFILPIALLVSTLLVFWSATRWLGQDLGYLTGFLFYWVFWCIFIPACLLKDQGGWLSVLKQEKPFFSKARLDAVLLFLVVTVISILMYWKDFTQAPLALVLVAIPVAIFNGFCEEALWRGLYTRIFPHQWLAGLVLPAIGFALWHFAPQSVHPSGTGVLPFVLSTLFLGLSYGWIAYRTGSARWTAISHSLSGIAAVGGPIALTILRLFS
jgi:membrane protease YdiL (CAAX protease family)